ncbi:MAG: heavy metal-binding domain-containing protein [Lachnospirales bacterium]
MKFSNLPCVEDKDYIVLGLVTGISSRSIPFSFKAIKPENVKTNFKENISGRAHIQESVVKEAYKLAMISIEEEANNLNADEIININVTFSNLSATTVEAFVYGTAIKYKV